MEDETDKEETYRLLINSITKLELKVFNTISIGGYFAGYSRGLSFHIVR